MASGEQLKALLKSHAEGDDDRFFSVAMQVAAHEARRGHGRLAEELRTLIDRAKSKPGAGAPVPIGRPRGELANLLEASCPSERLAQMVLGQELGDPDSTRDSGAAPRRSHRRAGSRTAAQVVVDGAAWYRQDTDGVRSRRRTGASTPAGAP